MSKLTNRADIFQPLLKNDGAGQVTISYLTPAEFKVRYADVSARDQHKVGGVVMLNYQHGVLWCGSVSVHHAIDIANKANWRGMKFAL